MVKYDAMKKPILILFLALGTLLISTTTQTTTYVYVCMGSSAVCYHKTNKCKGLTNCSKEIKKTTKSEAEKQKRRACKICYK